MGTQYGMHHLTVTVGNYATLSVLILGHPIQHSMGEYLLWCARGVCAVRVLGLFGRPFHPEPNRGNGNASEPTRYHLQLLSR